jgi:hypothetical protein
MAGLGATGPLQAAKRPKSSAPFRLGSKGFSGHNPPKTGGPTTTEVTEAH